jgi:hypothetical protein
MHAAYRRLNLASGVVLLLSALITGCGGGTTGTSSTDEFKFAGVAKSASGQPLSSTAMTVRSAGDDAELLQSATDSSGQFAMDLPASESSVVVAVGEARSAPLVRSFNGASVLSTEMVSTSAGDLEFQGTFEVQIDSANLCSALTAFGNQLYQQAPLSAGECVAAFSISSGESSAKNFSAAISGDCQASNVGNPLTDPQKGAQILIDLAPYLQAGCSRFEVVISHRASTERAASFAVYGSGK